MNHVLWRLGDRRIAAPRSAVFFRSVEGTAARKWLVVWIYVGDSLPMCLPSATVIGCGAKKNSINPRAPNKMELLCRKHSPAILAGLSTCHFSADLNGAEQPTQDGSAMFSTESLTLEFTVARISSND